MKWKLTHGTHAERGPGGAVRKIFRAGSKDNIVESDDNLAEKFPNKFEPVGDPEQAKFAKKPAGTRRAEVTKGTGGPRVNATGTGRGDDGLTPAAAAKAAKAKAKTNPQNAAQEEVDDEEGDEQEAGENDVTSDFPAAVDRDLVVTETEDGRFQVAAADSPEEFLTEAPLTRKGVEKYLSKPAKK